MSERTLTSAGRTPASSPLAPAPRAALEFLQAIVAGELPTAPIQELLGFSLDEAEEGRVVFSLEPGEQHYNPIGSVHGGVAATLLDSAMGAAVHSTLPQGAAYVTLEVKFNLVRPISAETGRVVAEGRVIHRGGTVATVEGDVRSAEGKLLAHGTSTCLIR